MGAKARERVVLDSLILPGDYQHQTLSLLRVFYDFNPELLPRTSIFKNPSHKLNLRAILLPTTTPFLIKKMVEEESD